MITDELLWLLLGAMPAIVAVFVGVVFLGLAVWVTNAVVRGERGGVADVAVGRDKALGIVLAATLVDFAFVLLFAALFAEPQPRLDEPDDPDEALPVVAKHTLPHGGPHARAEGLLRFGLRAAVTALLVKLLLPMTAFRALLVALWYEAVWLAVPVVVLFALEGPGLVAEWL